MASGFVPKKLFRSISISDILLQLQFWMTSADGLGAERFFLSHIKTGNLKKENIGFGVFLL